MELNDTLLKHIKAYTSGDNIPMHMPGHKRNPSGIDFLETLGAKYDLTEIDGFDNLHNASGILKESMERAAQVWGSENCFFLINGSTCGILASVRASAKISGKKNIIMARNCHMSVYNAAELCGLDPVYLVPQAIPEFSFYGCISPEDVANALEKYPGCPVIITSPTYEGVISNIPEISKICHSHGSILIVDEAHGAHLDLSPYFTGGAIKGGADIVVQSIHKTLTGLTQTELLHVGGELVSPKIIERQLAIFESSSPSYLLMSAIDGTSQLILSRGKELFEHWHQSIDLFDKKIMGLQNLRVPGHSELFACQSKNKALGKDSVFCYDTSKIIISCQGTEIGGMELAGRLRRDYNIECEMAAGDYAIAMTGLLEDVSSLVRLASALTEIDKSIKARVPSLAYRMPAPPPKKMSIEDALTSDSKQIFMKDSKSFISAEYVWAYPPGSPLLVPGEEISSETVSALMHIRNSGVELHSTLAKVPLYINVIKP